MNLARSAPMDLPDIIAAAWAAGVRHWWLLVRIALLGALLSAAINFALLKTAPIVAEGQEATEEQVRDALTGAAPLFAAATLVSLFTHLALVCAGLELLRGRPAGADAALWAAVRTLPAGLVAALITLAVGVSLVATVILAPLGLYFLINWLLTPQVIMDERRGSLGALRRSRLLVRGQWWHTCAVGLSVLVLYLFPGIVFSWVGASLGSDVAMSAAAGLATLLAAPFLALGHTQLYLDIRQRKGEPMLPTPPPERAS